MADVLEDNIDTPSILLPCGSCNRTFRPEALSKHSKVCEKTLMKKRKKFDSSKQRIQGTDLAEFLPILPTFIKKTDRSPIRKTQTQVSSTSQLQSSSKSSLKSPKQENTKWREKHNELVQTIKAARMPPGQAPVIKLSDQEACPYCERSFGPKAYDRHLEWCKEKMTRIQPKSPASQRAKERLEARTKYRAPPVGKAKRSASRDKIQPETSPHVIHTPLTQRKTYNKTNVMESSSVPNINRNLTKDTSLRKSTRGTSVTRTTQASRMRFPNAVKKVVTQITKKRVGPGSNDYDPYKSAEQQMLELMEPHPQPQPQKLTPISKSPSLVSSPTSAFSKFTSSLTPEPLFISENDNDTMSKVETKSHASSEKSTPPLTITSPLDNFSKDSNQNTINLSTLSLCSTISIESVDSNKNSYKMGHSNSARVPEKKTPLPLRRTVSAVESRKPSEPRRSRDPLKGLLKMEDLLYGSKTVIEGERYFGSPIISRQTEKNDNFHSSSGSLHKAVSDTETLNAEQELLKSMSEFEKIFSSSSSSSPSPSSPPLKLFPSLVSSFPADLMDVQDRDFSMSHTGGPDSAYSSLNRKSPVGGEQETKEQEVARFCHECGAKYPVLAAKFCCQCGVRRLVI
ncbi:uncharacterized protein LOC128988433 isoform X1 [Macrosteles quadrilineatus]|uniref:uncharacterized protein LOC128988433 isoform X1 n=1 Tax=Macrosteles quadrilineatus TaxID=74068 RepID=UPI0023E0D97A|nr:uncharacterized protein LOC128988433 isoform X1 [Macrosteles quadrilineatus]